MGVDDKQEKILWVLERQKQDYTEYQKQTRRYLIAAVSAAIALGIAYSQGKLQNFTESQIITELAKNGILWQLGFFSHHDAAVVVKSLHIFTILFSGIAPAYLFASLYAAYLIEQLPGCYPTGISQSVVTESEEYLLEQIEKNDKFIRELQDLRGRMFKAGQEAVVLFLFSVSLNLLMLISIFVYIIILIVGLHHMYTTLHGNQWVFNSSLRKAIMAVLIFITATRPATVYINLYGHPSLVWASIGILAAVTGNYVYFRHYDDFSFQSFLFGDSDEETETQPVD